jgi:hypothetical protein
VIIRINKAKDSPKKVRKQMNGKFSNMGSADENKYKNMTVQPLFKN